VSEQPTGGGAAFWAARGVRIEPEVEDEELVEEPEVLAGPEQVEEPEDAAEPEIVPEARTSEEDVHADAVVVEEVEQVEEIPLPGFPQQRSTDPRPEPAAPESEESAESAPTEEPAWQLTGGELALPLPPLKTCVEAILMVVDEPVSVVTLAQVLERPTAEVAEALRELAEEYTVLGRGFELREVGVGGEGERTGWRVYSRAECAPVVERFVRDGQQAKLTQAALETLAVVAYRQPVSRSKVSAIRGVNCDGVMRTLLARGLVEEYGNDHETGAVLYQTTGFFLERMGLKSLEELPDLAPLLPSAAEADLEDFA
jgi:segregation and condensation protein B